MIKMDAILLAAGMSKRMGQRNKLLLDWEGVPMIRHIAQTYLDAVGPAVTVITGHESDEVQAALAGLPLRFHHNPDFESGQQSSVAAALSLHSAADATLIGLGDLPLLTVANLQDLMKAHAPDRISIPYKGDQRGNPIIIPQIMRARMLADSVQPGCKRFTRQNPDLVQKLPFEAAGFFTDIDTPETYANHRKGASNEIAIQAD
ncbi:MAG: nucleotidyltransferase family protein [Rhodobacteraceae bacterium]|nr:nucleotidyltransferase family protein [Paracoccaceae bacterium]